MREVICILDPSKHVSKLTAYHYRKHQNGLASTIICWVIAGWLTVCLRGLDPYFQYHSCIIQCGLTILTPTSSVLNNEVSCLHPHKILAARGAWFSCGHLYTRFFSSYDDAAIFNYNHQGIWKPWTGIMSTSIPLWPEFRCIRARGGWQMRSSQVTISEH